jgi:Ca2+-binding RTX toxin-like protein
MIGNFTLPIGIGMYGSIDGITLGTTGHEINLSGVILDPNTPYVTAEYIADSTIDVSSWKVNAGASSPASFVIWGESGNQTVGASGVNSSIKGSNGADALFGGARTDTLTLAYKTGDSRDSGGSGNDTLNGGLGDDYLSGGAGSDTFFFDNSGTASTWNAGKDTVLDFGVGGQNTTALANATITGLNGDVLQFSNADLAALTGFVNTNDAAYVTPTSTSGSTIKSAGLVAGATATATGTTAQFLYNSTTGSLKFDVDGGGTGAAIDVATILPIGLSLTATDFLIVA